ncbi:MAG: hypothetical protein AAF570_10000, partial [Bacteroidota bacterium]
MHGECSKYFPQFVNHVAKINNPLKATQLRQQNLAICPVFTLSSTRHFPLYAQGFLGIDLAGIKKNHLYLQRYHRSSANVAD